MIDLSRKKESSIEEKFRKTCQRYGGDAIKLTSPGRNGLPDRLVQWPGGVTTYAELKKPGKDLDPDQVVEVKRMRELGLVVHVIHNDMEIAQFISESLQRVLKV